MRHTIRRGDYGVDVTTLQVALRARGYQIEPDGVFGRATEESVKLYQAKERLMHDGICGPETWARLGFSPMDRHRFSDQPRRTSPVRRIIIHHTVTRSVEDTIRVLGYRGLSTHYVVGPDGNWIETLDPADCRARHAGGHNRDSIGVDIVNPLDVDIACQDGTWDDIWTAPWAPASDGHRYRLDTPAAVVGTWQLVGELCNRFSIPRKWIREYKTLDSSRTKAPGIYAHGQLADSRWDGFAMLSAWDAEPSIYEMEKQG